MCLHEAFALSCLSRIVDYRLRNEMADTVNCVCLLDMKLIQVEQRNESLTLVRITLSDLQAQARSHVEAFGGSEGLFR